MDGDEKVFMCLVDNADGQLAHAAGGTPSKPHEWNQWMVSNLLSPSSTLAMQAQSDYGGCGKLIVSGFINAKDNEATEQTTELTAPASSPGFVHHPKMGGRICTLPSVF